MVSKRSRSSSAFSWARSLGQRTPSYIRNVASAVGSAVAAELSNSATKSMRSAVSSVSNAAAARTAAYVNNVRSGMKGYYDRMFDPRLRRAKGKYRTLGTYKGRIKKRKFRPGAELKYMRHGFKNTTEIRGTVSDPDCVYIGHGTTVGSRLLTLFLQASLRKLFKIGARQVITSVDEPLRGYQSAGNGWRLILYIEDKGDGSITEVSYNTAATDTILSITGNTASGTAPGWPDLYNYWFNYIAAAGGSGAAGSTQQPIGMSLLRTVVTAGDVVDYQHCGDLWYQNETINLMVKSQLKIQNRTLGANANSESDDVTNNPIQGKLYQMSQGAPRTKVEGVRLLETVFDWTGVTTARAAQFTQAQVNDSKIMREPPSPNIFVGVTKVGKVRLDPGHIKKDVITYKVRMNVYKFFERLDWRPSSVTSTALQMKVHGKFTLMALEDVINVNSTQNISIAYEVNRDEMMYLSTGRTQVAQGLFSDMEQNANP